MGTVASVAWSSTALVSNEGTVEYIISTGNDITQRKQTQAILRQQALTFQTIYDGIIITDLDGRIIDWNPAAERMFGYSKSEVLGKTPGILHRPFEVATLTPKILVT
jgi:PAS domain-containing protein